MKIGIASGKGGVGKSFVASALSILFSKEFKIVACDCDVDAPNLGIWLKVEKYDKVIPLKLSEKAFIINQSVIDERLIKECRFGAIQKVNNKIFVNPLLCEGCGLCKILYPNGIKMEKVVNCEIRIKEKTKYGFPLISGKLLPGEKGSGKIVEELKKYAERFEHEIQILDCAAGLGCVVNSCLNDVDFALLVTEPTKTAINDLERIIDLINFFGINYGIIINKWDLNKSLTKTIIKKFNRKIIGKIPHSKKIFEVIVSKKEIFELNEIRESFRKIYNRLLSLLL